MTRGLVRWGAIFFVAMLVTVAWKVHDATTPAATVHACSYSFEHSKSASTTFYSVYFQANDILHAEVVTYAGNTGSGYQCAQYKEYEVYQWTTLGTPGSYFSEVRAWTCGGYDGDWAAGSSSVWSAQLYYPIGCGRQADDYGSYFHDAYGGENVSVYVNQG